MIQSFISIKKYCFKNKKLNLTINRLWQIQNNTKKCEKTIKEKKLFDTNPKLTT